MLFKLIITTISILSAFFSYTPTGELRVEPCIVYEVSEQETVVEDSTGNLWAFSCGCWEEGEHCAIVLTDNGTEEKEDDIILAVSRPDMMCVFNPDGSD